MPPSPAGTDTLSREAFTSSRSSGGTDPPNTAAPTCEPSLAVAGSVARLWGGAVLESARGQGVYRAVLAARLAYGAAHGATMALVKGRVETSGPILRRAGFAAYGQEVIYRVPLA